MIGNARGTAGSAEEVGASANLVEAADARARDSISCHHQTVGVDAATGIARIILGDVDTQYSEDFQHDLTVSPARILSTPLTTVTGQGDIHIGGDRLAAPLLQPARHRRRHGPDG